MARQPRPIIERLMEKVQKDANGCWIFTGGKRWGGYGQIRIGSAQQGIAVTHRVTYEHFIGPIPTGMVLDHRCRVHACCNPGHLRPVTVKQNAEHLDGARADNQSSAVRGVTFTKKNKARPWQAQVGHNGKCYYAGSYATIPEAEAAVRAKRAELFTHDDHDQWTFATKGQEQ